MHDEYTKLFIGNITGNNNVIQQGDGTNIININQSESSKITSYKDEVWRIKLLNEISNPITIGDYLIFDLFIETPKSQYSTPYVFYAAYLDRNKWCQFYSLKIGDEESHFNLIVDTYKLGINEGEYIFGFALFRSEDYSEGNSMAEFIIDVNLVGNNEIFAVDVFDKNVTVSQSVLLVLSVVFHLLLN